MSDSETDRLLGQLMAKVDAVREDVRDLKSAHHQRLNDHGDRIDSLEHERTERKAGARWLAVLLTAAGAAGATFLEAIRLFVSAWRGV